MEPWTGNKGRDIPETSRRGLLCPHLVHQIPTRLAFEIRDSGEYFAPPLRHGKLDVGQQSSSGRW